MINQLDCNKSIRNYSNYEHIINTTSFLLPQVQISSSKLIPSPFGILINGTHLMLVSYSCLNSCLTNLSLCFHMMQHVDIFTTMLRVSPSFNLNSLYTSLSTSTSSSSLSIPTSTSLSTSTSNHYSPS